MSDHGHVTPRADGLVGLCGGPGICVQCSEEVRALAEQRRLDDALAEVERLKAEVERLRALLTRANGEAYDGSLDHLGRQFN